MSKVIIVPGNLASSLNANGYLLWLNPLRLAFGGFNLMKLGPYIDSEQETSADPSVTIEPVGPLPFLYDRIHVYLSLSGHNVSIWPYDFRLDIDHLAAKLVVYIDSLNESVAIITHSQGGAVCRRAIQLTGGHNVSQLIMLAPSISGTLISAVSMAGDIHDIPFVGSFPMIGASPQPVLKTFTALYQLLPWDSAIIPSLANPQNDIRQLSFWDGLVDPDRLKLVGYGSKINTDFFNDKMKIILGSGSPTAGAVKMTKGSLSVDHTYDLPGDGFMAHVCSTIPGVDTYVADGVGHLGLPLNEDVINGIIALLEGRAPTTIKPFPVGPPPPNPFFGGLSPWMP